MPKQDTPALAEVTYSRPDFWLSGSSPETEVKKFVPPSPVKKRADGGESLKESNWIGGSCGDSPVRRSKRTSHPDQIKIEGARSIKDSPFFK